LENRTINIAVVAEVAAALKDLKDNMVFVGGAVVSLYTDDPAADEIRPTQDIDMTLNIVSFSHWQEVQEKLGELGFHPNPFGHAICSYKYKNIPVDIMATEDGPLGPANPWYKPGFEYLWTVKAKDQEIKILSAPYFLATKFQAFNNRGKDYRTSHDIEDIIYVIDNRTSIVDEVRSSDQLIREFLKQEIQRIINKGLLSEVIMTHIHPLMVEDRFSLVEDKINLILQMK
jgi:predicted nucleotidyltransferase